MSTSFKYSKNNKHSPIYFSKWQLSDFSCFLKGLSWLKFIMSCFWNEHASLCSKLYIKKVCAPAEMYTSTSLQFQYTSHRQPSSYEDDSYIISCISPLQWNNLQFLQVQKQTTVLLILLFQAFWLQELFRPSRQQGEQRYIFMERETRRELQRDRGRGGIHVGRKETDKAKVGDKKTKEEEKWA